MAEGRWLVAKPRVFSLCLGVDVVAEGSEFSILLCFWYWHPKQPLTTFHQVRSLFKEVGWYCAEHASAWTRKTSTIVKFSINLYLQSFGVYLNECLCVLPRLFLDCCCFHNSYIFNWLYIFLSIHGIVYTTNLRVCQ